MFRRDVSGAGGNLHSHDVRRPNTDDQSIRGKAKRIKRNRISLKPLRITPVTTASHLGRSGALGAIHCWISAQAPSTPTARQISMSVLARRLNTVTNHLCPLIAEDRLSVRSEEIPISTQQHSSPVFWQQAHAARTVDHCASDRTPQCAARSRRSPLALATTMRQENYVSFSGVIVQRAFDALAALRGMPLGAHSRVGTIRPAPWHGNSSQPEHELLMQTIMLIRHGYQASWDDKVKGRGTPPHQRLDPGLAEIGKRQAELTAALLAANGGADAVISSPFRRCLETAEVIATACKVNVAPD